MRTELFYQTLDSTLTEIARLDELVGDANDWVIRAGEQTAGRGRGENSWLSPPGGLWLGLTLRHPSGVASFPLYVGTCVHSLLLALLELEGLRIKWPNDIYLGDKKLGGILCEYQQTQGKYIIGIGINTNNSINQVISDIYASNLYDNIKMPLSTTILGNLLVQRIQQDAERELSHPSGYLGYCDTWLFGKGRQAEITGVREPLQGTISGLGSGGELLLKDPLGVTHSITVGTLRLL